MPILPSGRQVELSTDRFKAYLANIDPDSAAELFDSLKNPDDVLFIADVVYLAESNATPMFAGYVATDWEAHCQDWPEDDQVAFRNWLISESAALGRAEELSSIKDYLENAVLQPSP